MHVGSVGRRFKYKINTVRGQDQQEFVSLWLSDSVEDTSFTLSSLSKDFINRIGSIGRRSSAMVEKQMGRPASVGRAKSLGSIPKRSAEKVGGY